jgi:hypothetical protein
MLVSAWNNGKHYPTGAGYGIKIKAKDRDAYFDKEWEYIVLILEGRYGGIRVNIDKKSFWDPICRELCHKEIGLWLKKNFKIPWKKSKPYKLIMEHIRDNRFKVTQK